MSRSEERIAIVGAACAFPDAPDLASYRRNILAGRVHTRDFPIDQRWGEGIYRPDAAPSMTTTYNNQGGVIDYPLEFDPIEYKLPPKELWELDPDQLLATQLTRAALADAGIEVDLNALPSLSCGVVLGRIAHVGPASVRVIDLVRMLPQTRALIESLLPDTDPGVLDEFERRFLEQRGRFTGTRGISMMSSLLSSRVAERLNLNGPSYIVDGACASSLIAVQHAARELRLGNAEMMAAGGVLFPVMSGLWTSFSYMGAMSRKGSIRAFDRAADGIVLGEGGGIVILKTLSRARQDGDRIYAVLEALECNNDGRGHGILAPSQAGQELVIRRTWSQVDLRADQVSFVECHGTGTPLGDRTEVGSMTATLGAAAGTGHRIAIGSVKAQIGHTLAAAGVAALIKTALCLYHRTIPPASNWDDPIDGLAQGPFYLPGQPAPLGGNQTLYACVNAFGFGGVNSHAILSSADIAPASPAAAVRFGRGKAGTGPQFPPSDLSLARASAAELLQALEAGDRETGAGSHRLIVRHADAQALQHAAKVIRSGRRSRGNKGVFYSADGLLESASGKLAFLFPGFSYHELNVRPLLERHGIDVSQFDRLTHQSGSASDADKRGSTAMMMSYGLAQVLKRRGLAADGMAGMSLGEFAAFIAAGVLDGTQIEKFLRALETSRGAGALWDEDYLMLSVSNASVDRLTAVTRGLADTYISLVNSGSNAVVTVHKDRKAELIRRFQAERILSFDIGLRTVNHTPLNKPLMDDLRPMIFEIEPGRPTVELWSSVTAQRCANDRDALRQVLYQNMYSRVDFHATTQHMHDAGYRVFVQCGLGGMSSYVAETLHDRPHLALDAVSSKLGHEEALDDLFRNLWVEGLSARGQAVVAPPPRRPRLPFRINDLVAERCAPADLVAGLKWPASLATKVGDSAAVEFDSALPPGGAELLRAGQETFALAQAEVMKAFLGTADRGAALPVRPTVPLETPRSPAPVVPQAFEPVSWTVLERFDFQRFPEFRDHEILKHPPEIADRHRSAVVPLSAMLFRTCEVVNERFPGRLIRRLVNVQAKKFIDMKEPREIEAAYRQVTPDRVEVRWGEHFSCHVELCDSIAFEACDDSSFVVTQPFDMAPMAYYENGQLFHGKSFQGLVSVEGSNERRDMIGTCRSPGGYSALLDSIFHISACWYYTHCEDTSNLVLPYTVDSLEFCCDSRDFIGDVYAQGRCTIFNAEMGRMLFSWDTDYFTQGRMILKIRGFKDFKFESSVTLQAMYRQPERVDSGVSQEIAEGVYVYDAVIGSTWSWDLLSACYLTGAERTTLERIRLFPDRTAFICGRVAAKDAYRFHTGRPQHLARLDIGYEAHGAPRYQPAGESDAVPVMSLAHKRRIGVCAIAPAGHCVGVDVEQIESAARLNTALVFGPGEMELIAASPNPDLVKAILWTAKEAFIKSSADRHARYANRLAAVRVTSLAQHPDDALRSPVQAAHSGLINGEVAFRALQYGPDHVISFLREARP